jgi:DNA-binding transcriptional ArsR family regulator
LRWSALSELLETDTVSIMTRAPEPPSRERVEAAAALMQALSYAPRLEIVLAIQRRECTPTELGSQLSLTPTVISHQLRHLNMVGALRRRRNGSHVVYSIAPGIDALLRAALSWSRGMADHTKR